MSEKVVYIAHPVGGDVQGNIKDVLSILRDISFGCRDIIPIAPYVVCCQYLNDDIPEERAMGIVADNMYFKRRYMDEVWFSGPRFSFGMKEEVKLCLEHGLMMDCYQRDKHVLRPELEKLIVEYAPPVSELYTPEWLKGNLDMFMRL